MPVAVQKETPSTESKSSDLLTRSDVARILGVSPTTVTRWAREGRLPCRVTLGGHHRFERSLVEQIRDRMMRGEVAEPEGSGRTR
jgi:excisionase family DNA binding protein